MIFSELYGAYYNTIASVLKIAIKHPINKNNLRDIIEKTAFGESVLSIEPALFEQRWQLIRSDGSTPIKHSPTLPLTTLEKRWLKAIYADPRIKLFTDEESVFSDVEPLFTADDFYVFDKYADGDPYEDENYKRNFRLILDAIEKQYPLKVDATNRKGTITHKILMPEYLEYSEKDDKFRLVGFDSRTGSTVNLGRIVSCKPYAKPYKINPNQRSQPKTRTVEFELNDQRNALERVLLHFAHFKKQAERIENNRYRITLTYDKNDETEMVIRILSFGPMIKVTAPQNFVELIKERLINQKSCEH